MQKDRIMCILPLIMLWLQRDLYHLEVLLEQPFILPKWGGDNEIERLIRQHAAKLNVVYEVAEDQAIMAMVQSGLGISLLPEMVLQNHTKSLALVPLAGPLPKDRFSLCFFAACRPRHDVSLKKSNYGSIRIRSYDERDSNSDEGCNDDSLIPIPDLADLHNIVLHACSP